MARIKRSVSARKKRRATLKEARGYYGAKSRSYKNAKQQVRRSLQYQYRDRRLKKRTFRRLWITRINAAARQNGMSYSTFIHGLSEAGVLLDRKALAEIAVSDPKGFSELAKIAKKTA